MQKLSLFNIVYASDGKCGNRKFWNIIIQTSQNIRSQNSSSKKGKRTIKTEIRDAWYILVSANIDLIMNCWLFADISMLSEEENIHNTTCSLWKEVIFPHSVNWFCYDWLKESIKLFRNFFIIFHRKWILCDECGKRMHHITACKVPYKRKLTISAI